MDHWAPADVEAHTAFLHHVNELLKKNGEYVDARALTPTRTWVRYGGPDAAPVTTDGPHPETRTAHSGTRGRSPGRAGPATHTGTPRLISSVADRAPRRSTERPRLPSGGPDCAVASGCAHSPVGGHGDRSLTGNYRL